MALGVVLSTAALGGDETAPAKGDAEALRGVWALTSRSVGGIEVPNDPTSGPMLTAFAGDFYLQRQGESIVEEGTYTVDPGKSPATIDLQIKKGPEAGKRQLGIYEADGDSLRLCLAPPGVKRRPKDFEPRNGSSALLVVCRRFRP
jgi:uncharacterized protein (TIGR03067 family)